MATDMADLAASIGRMAKQQNPEAYGEWDDAELGAQLLIQNQGQTQALFQSSNEMDPEGNAVVRPDRIERAWSHAASIGADPQADLYAQVRGLPAGGNPSREPTIRARTYGEAINDMLRSVYQSAAALPHGQVADALGVSNLKGMAESFDTRDTGARLGILYPGPLEPGAGTTEEVGGAGRGLYSRVDDAVSRLPAKGAHPNKIAGILKSNASAEELAYRQVPEFLAAKGNATVTPAELQAHLEAHPAPMPAVKTLGDLPPDLIAARTEANARIGTLRAAAFDDPTDWVGVSQNEKSNAAHWALEAAGGDARALEKLQGVAVDPDHLETLLAYGRARADWTALEQQMVGTRPKYSQYQVPGGNQYRETLLTLPEAGEEGFQRLLAQRDAVDRAIEAHLPKDRYGQPDRFAAVEPELREQYNRIQRQIDAMQEAQFRSSHFDEPNILVHTRSNMRTLPTGERGRFLEEVQSDWHQQGKTQGYQEAALPSDVAANWSPAHHAEVLAARRANAPNAVPDAPFKESWPDLGVKQQLLEAAQDPETQWIGFTSGQTQANRYNLRKMIDRLYYDPRQQRLMAFGSESSGATGTVIDEIVAPNKLAETIGKEASKRLLEQPIQQKRFLGDVTDVHVLEGENLEVGGEGMRHFYDQLLPKRLEKIVKPFGGKVERTGIPAGVSEAAHGTRALGEAFFDAAPPGSLINGKLPVGPSRRLFSREELGEAFLSGRINAFDMPNYLQDAVQRAGGVKEPAWIVRLTPEMKARILKEGLPLMTIGGIAAASQLGPDSDAK